MNAIAAKAVAFHEALQPEFSRYQEAVVANAQRLASGLVGRGLRLVSGGTDNHLMLVDVKASGITGKEAQARLAQIGITANRNTIPFDSEKPMVTSGIRLGTPQVTTRGLGPLDMDELADVIATVIRESNPNWAALQKRVRALADAYPLPGISV